MFFFKQKFRKDNSILNYGDATCGFPVCLNSWDVCLNRRCSFKIKKKNSNAPYRPQVTFLLFCSRHLRFSFCHQEKEKKEKKVKRKRKIKKKEARQEVSISTSQRAVGGNIIIRSIDGPVTNYLAGNECHQRNNLFYFLTLKWIYK